MINQVILLSQKKITYKELKDKLSVDLTSSTPTPTPTTDGYDIDDYLIYSSKTSGKSAEDTPIIGVKGAIEISCTGDVNNYVDIGNLLPTTVYRLYNSGIYKSDVVECIIGKNIEFQITQPNEVFDGNVTKETETFSSNDITFDFDYITSQHQKDIDLLNSIKSLGINQIYLQKGEYINDDDFSDIILSLHILRDDSNTKVRINNFSVSYNGKTQSYHSPAGRYYNRNESGGNQKIHLVKSFFFRRNTNVTQCTASFNLEIIHVKHAF